MCKFKDSYRKILHISYKDRVTNEEVRAKLQQAIGPHEDLTIVKRRKLHWYGHVSRSPGLAKTILQGTVKGGRRQGRQGKRWENNIREWTGLEFANPTRQRRTEKNEGNWLWSHLWCPQRPPRLKARWRWRYSNRLHPLKWILLAHNIFKPSTSTEINCLPS